MRLLMHTSFKLSSRSLGLSSPWKALLFSTMAESVGQKRSAEEDCLPSKRLCEAPTPNTGDRIKRRKVVLLMGYCGQGYLGMQRNPGFKTIEEDLLTAMQKANLITDEAFNFIQSIQFQRAARTDKGVSAVKQIVSLKLPEDTTVEAINDHLPECIRVFAIRRVTKGFNSKSSCDARTYSYMLPTSAFCIDNVEHYRITPELIEKIKEAMQIFIGTHNFHNFTAKKKAHDPSAIRYIFKFECEDPFVKDDMEFMRFKVKGQSFMLHQIRKMIGTIIAIVRGITTVENIQKAWSEPRIDLPMAPGLGLVLEEVHYDRYNAKFGKDGMHECLTWEKEEKKINLFKEKYIDPVIVETEKQEQSMFNWIQTLHLHSFDVRNRHVHEVHNGDGNSNLQPEENDSNTETNDAGVAREDTN